MYRKLGIYGYAGLTAFSAADALHAARTSHPDIVIFGPSLPDMELLALAQALRQDPATSDIPLFLLAPADDKGLAAQALGAGIDEIMAPPFHEGILFARLRPLVRLSTMQGELRQRAAIARGFGLDVTEKPARPVVEQGYSLLVVGDDATPVVRLLEGEARLTVTASLFEAEDLLTRNSFDAAIVFSGANPEGVLAFCGQLRHNPRLFNLPVILLAQDDALPDRADAYRWGVSRVLGLPLDPDRMRHAVLTLVRRQRFRWVIRQSLTQTLADATRNPQAGVYGHAFLESYLAARLADAKARSRHLAVLLFAFPAVESLRAQFGDEAASHLLHQLGQWITGLLRAEDLNAYWGDNAFCVVLPDTPLDEAEIVMHRIAGVLGYTDFAIPDVYQPVKVWLQVGATTVEAEDTPATVLARLRGKLD